MSSKHFVLVFTILSSTIFYSCNKSKKENAYNQAILNAIDSVVHTQHFKNDLREKELQATLESFYKKRQNKNAWLGNEKNKNGLEQLLNFTRNTKLDGLQPEMYHFSELNNLFNEYHKRLKEKKIKKMIAPDSLAKLEVQASASYLLLVSHLVHGRIESGDSTWRKQKRFIDLESSLQKTVDENKVLINLQELVPRTRNYILLKQKLKQYRKIQKEGGWKKIPVNLKIGYKSPAVILLKKRLAISFTTKNQDLRNDNFDESVQNAVKKYQLLYGLPQTGEVDDRTRKSMNKTAETRVAQIEINLERMRWLPGKRATNAIVVNLPEYALRVYKGEVEMMKMRVIIGDEVKATPIMRDTLQYLVFSPTWTVPKSIMIKEMLPQIKRRPNYFETHDLEVYTSYSRRAIPIDPETVDWQEVTPENFNYRFVQRPGSENPLGLVKFMFPNKMSIYLHDSPGKNLFNADKRTMSHGCVRIEKPFDLAMYVLSDQPKFDSTNIDSFMHIGVPKDVIVHQKFEIRFTYYTTFVDAEGNLNFRSDIYHHDEKQLEQVKEVVGL